MKPVRPVKKIISRRFKSRDELRIRLNDEVFRERYGSQNSSSLSQRKIDAPVKNRNHFREKNMKELFMLEYNSKEWSPMKNESDTLLQLESFSR